MSTTVSYPEANLTITYTFSDPRTLPPVLLHFLLLRIVALIGLYHLVSYQRLPKGPRGKYGQSVLLFIFLPTTPLASIICRLFYCLRIALTKPWPSDRHGFLVYLSSAVLGLRTWANAASLVEIVERGGLVSEIPPNANDNTNSSSLLSGNASDFQWLKCTCKERICCRYKNFNLYRPIALLTPILLYCTISFIIYIRRCSHDYVYMVIHLLQGTPPGSHEADIYPNALETISGFDQLNAMWAIGGMVVTASALVLKVTGWHFMWNELGNESDRKTSEPPMLSYAEFALSLILYVCFTWQVWARFFLGWNPADPISVILTIGKLGVGIFAVNATYCWARGEKLMKKEATGTTVVLAWIVCVTEWPVIYAVIDVWELVSCVTGGRCPYPLFLWKDAWSDFLRMY